MGSRYLLINLSHLHLRSLRNIDSNYISVHWDGRFYFSNAYNSSQAVKHSITLNHNIVLELLDDSTLSLLMQSWENHMIIFQHQVDLSELKSRSATRKRVEIRQGEILDFTVHLLKQNEFHLNSNYNEDLIQHFLFIHNLTLYDQDKNPDFGPSYIVVEHSAGSMVLPVVNAVAIISLPSKVKFKHYKNGKLRSTSRFYECQEVAENGRIRMVAGEDIGYDLEVTMLWGINLWHNLPQRSMLLDAQQILIYEIEARLQAWKEVPTGLKFKVIYGSKSFELNGEAETFTLKFARIIYFVMKSQQEDFIFALEKNLKTVAKIVIGSEEILSYHLNNLKRKLLDSTGKQMASIKFKCEKAKNLSLPQNNAFWRNNSVKGKNPAIKLQFSQLSVEWQKNQYCGLIIKTEEEELFVPELTNFGFFKLEIDIPEPAVLTMHQEGNVYLKLVTSESKVQFLGIAVLKFGDLRLGMNVLTLPFFKQQTATCLLHLIVNKVVPWPFVRGLNVPQGASGLALRLIGISVQIHRIQLTGYYLSYQYDRKNEMYCIVEINRIKKVLILEKFNTLTKALLFVNSAGSDLLNFTVDHNQSARIRFTVLVGDGGFEEEVYGVLQKKVRVDQLKEGPMRFQKQQISNDHGISVGIVDFQVQLGLSGQFKKPIKKDLKNVQNSLDKVNRSIERVERSMSKNRINKLNPPPKMRYESLKLPEIKDPRQERLKRLAKMLQMKEKSTDHRKLEKRRVQSQRRADIVNHSQVLKNYTSVQRPQQSHINLETQQEKLQQANFSKVNLFLQDLDDNQFLDTGKQ